MNTMNLVTNTSAVSQADAATMSRTTDLTTLNAQKMEDWFAQAGLAVIEVSHCASASCPICFHNGVTEGVTEPAQAA